MKDRIGLPDKMEEREDVIFSTIKDIRKIMDERNISLREVKIVIDIIEDVRIK